MSALRKVLVVDDDPVVSTSFDRVLSREGYIVVTAHNGAEALDKLSDGEYDVVYTDIKMPGMSGLELAEKVKARRSWTPVVIITGYGTEAAERRAKAAGVNAFLHKPLTAEMIEASAKEAMDSAPVAEAAPAAPVVAAPAEPKVEAAPAAPTSGLKAAGMIVAGPLLGLAYAVLFPFIGLAMLVGMGLRAYFKSGSAMRTLKFFKDVGLFFSAPFLGLAYIVTLPFVGIATFAWMGLKAVSKKTRTS